MKKYILCFVFDKAGGYRPIPYTELMEEDGARKPEYADRYFLPLHGYLMEVRHEDYLDHYRNERRQRYIREASSRLGIVSYNALDSEDLLGEDILRDIFTNVEDSVITDILLDKLREALLDLEPEEHLIIRLIYFEGQTERQCAEVLELNSKTLHSRKKRILEKLKKIIEF